MALLVGATRGNGAAPLPAARPDVVLVTIDTLRWDAPGFAGGRRAETPHLDRLAAEGRVFTNAQAHNVVTLPSHANILTGFYPHQHGVRDNSGFRLPAGIPTVATLLRSHGYATGAFVSGFPLDSRFGLAAGFAEYDDRFSRAVRDDELALAERRGDEAVAAALAWWEANAATPRFLWLHLYDPHAPYEPPEPFATRFRDAPYYGEVSAVDSYLAPLVDAIRARARRPAFLAFTSDHGEALGDHGEATHGLFCYRSTLQVPLFLWGSGVEPGREARLARHVDLFPTLLAAAGVAAPAEPREPRRPGRSLLADPPEGADAASYFEALSTSLNRGWAPLRGLVARSTKAIALPLPELYDLASDPDEARNLVDRERRRYRELIAGLPAESSWPPARSTVREEESRGLAALGYLGGSAAARSEPTPDDDPKRLLELDRKISATFEAAQGGRSAEAVRLAGELVATRPEMALGRSLLAQALLQAGERAAALAVMRRARQDGVTTDTLLRQLALTLVEQGDADEALAVVAPLVAAGDLDARVVRAQALSDAGHHDDAAAELIALDALEPEDGRVLEMLALVELRRGRAAPARDAARRAVRASPGNARAWNNLGVAELQLGDAAAALAAWRRAVGLDPHLWDAWWNLGVQSAVRGRIAEARDALTRFAEGAPGDRYARDRDEARRMLARLPPPPR